MGPTSGTRALATNFLESTMRFRAVLRLASEGKSLYADCAGRSEHGARLLTVRALVRRGLLDGADETISSAGREALLTSGG